MKRSKGIVLNQRVLPHGRSAGIALLLAALSLATARAQTAPELIEVQPDTIFAPAGFDDNDNAQVVLHGTFPDACHKIGPTELVINHERREIAVIAKAYYYRNALCAQVRQRWSKPVELGPLPSANYRVVARMTGRADQAKAELPVGIAQVSRPDEHDYAAVTDAVVTGLARDEQATLELFGTHAMTCLRVTEVRTVYTAKNVIEVMPIIQVNPDVPCAYPFLPIPFKKTVQLERRFKGPVLVHVRSVEGSAVNRVVEFP
jgi:hypothetical protein